MFGGIESGKESMGGCLKQSVVLLLVFAVLLLGCIDNLESEKPQQQESVRTYIIVLNDINTAVRDLTLSRVNYDNAGEYLQYNPQGYIYTDAANLFKVAEQQTLDAEERLEKTKIQLQGIQNAFEDALISEDIQNRLEQIEVLLKLSKVQYSMISYHNRELYEVNYGTTEKAEKYYNKRLLVVEEYMVVLDELALIQRKIDVAWNKDWYVTPAGLNRYST